tara:strand:+ start:8733 stop:8915 length:183 start_codon:yes stop_codon:yes gene_type:complete
MKKEFYKMLESKIGKRLVSYPELSRFLSEEGFTSLQVQAIIKKYFHPTLNAFILKSLDNE